MIVLSRNAVQDSSIIGFTGEIVWQTIRLDALVVEKQCLHMHALIVMCTIHKHIKMHLPCYNNNQLNISSSCNAKVKSIECHLHALMCSVTVVFIHTMEDDQRLNTLVHEGDVLHFPSAL